MLLKLVEFSFAMPESNAAVESQFLFVNNVR